jgi:hypothetical protein
MKILHAKGDLRRLWRDLVFHDRRGVLTFELAMVVSALSLISMAIIDLSLAYSRKAEMTNVVRAGTQFALVRRPSLGPDATEQEELLSLTEIRGVVVQSANFLESDPGTPALQVSVFCECPDTTIVECTADAGVPVPCQDSITLLSITLNQAYIPIMEYPGLPTSFGLKASNTIRLN